MVTVKVYPITGSLVDLFFGDGWEDWSRIYVTTKVGHPVRKQDITIMGGAKRSMSLLVSVVESIRK